MYISVFSPNRGKYWLEITSYLDTFYAVNFILKWRYFFEPISARREENEKCEIFRMNIKHLFLETWKQNIHIEQ